MPETVEPQIEEVSEAALVERIQLRKVGAAVDLYDQLLQAGECTFGCMMSYLAVINIQLAATHGCHI